MALNDTIASLVNSMPDLDKSGKVDGPPRPKADETFAAILAEGDAGVGAVIDMIKPVESRDDWKARYTLHGLVMYAGAADRAKQADAVRKALVAKLGEEKAKSIKAFLIQQLQLIGNASSAAAIGKHLTDEELSDDAAAALTAIAYGHGASPVPTNGGTAPGRAAALEQFRAALPNAKGKSKLDVVQALAVLRDEKSVGALKRAAADDDSKVRLAALWGLAHLGEASAVDLLIRATDAAENWQRAKLTDACLEMGEQLLARGDQTAARKVHTHLRDTRRPNEAHLGEAATKQLQ